jgi:hypothetical protein
MQFGFRPDDYKRFNNSAVRMAVPEVPKMFLWKDKSIG